MPEVNRMGDINRLDVLLLRATVRSEAIYMRDCHVPDIRRDSQHQPHTVCDYLRIYANKCGESLL